ERDREQEVVGNDPEQLIREVAQEVRLDQAQFDAEEAEEEPRGGQRECRRIADQHEKDHAGEHQRRHILRNEAHWRGFSYLKSSSITCSMAAMRLMISEMPCRAIRPKPTGSNSLTGQRTSPPALEEPSFLTQASTKKGQVK